MDYINFVLIAALALVTYLLVLAWQKDYPLEIAKVVLPEASPQLLRVSASDLPTQIPIAPDDNVESPQTESLPTSSNFINVTTDTFELTIDLNGGDIIYLALPQYLRQAGIPNDPFVLLEPRYVSQSGLIGFEENGERAVYRANSTQYKMEEDEESLVVDLLTTNQNRVEVTKQFIFKRDSYLIDVNFKVKNTSSDVLRANPFGQIKRDSYDDPSKARGLISTFLGFTTTSQDDPYIKIDFDDIDDQSSANEMKGGWIGFSQHYFVSAWIPSRSAVNNFFTRQNDSNQYFGGFTSTTLVVEPNSEIDYQLQFYAGPKDQYRLRDISPNLEKTIDYGVFGFLATPIYWLLTKINSIIGNFGYSIIVLTFIVKAAFYKLSEKQYKSSAGMKKLAPQIQQLKDKYGEDKLTLQKETMALYKKENVSLFGGCLPALVQMPVFMALYWVLIESIELRHVPFLFWINDLSVYDPYFVLPIMAGAMYLQSTFNPKPADPMQAKLAKFLPLMMTGLFLLSPAGLVLYFITNYSLSTFQQWMVTRKYSMI